jgi:hypothetical protein
MLNNKTHLYKKTQAAAETANAYLNAAGEDGRTPIPGRWLLILALVWAWPSWVAAEVLAQLLLDAGSTTSSSQSIALGVSLWVLLGLAQCIFALDLGWRLYLVSAARQIRSSLYSKGAWSFLATHPGIAPDNNHLDRYESPELRIINRSSHIARAVLKPSFFWTSILLESLAVLMTTQAARISLVYHVLAQARTESIGTHLALSETPTATSAISVWQVAIVPDGLLAATALAVWLTYRHSFVSDYGRLCYRYVER